MRLNRLKLPEHEVLHALFEDAGNTLRRRVRRGPAPAGALVTHKNASGYYYVSINGKQYLVHRVLWKMRTGEEPPTVVDHKDGDRTNNLQHNLQKVTQAENIGKGLLEGTRSDNTTGVSGISVRRGRFLVRLQVQGVAHHGGYHNCFLDAVAARYRLERAHVSSVILQQARLQTCTG